MNTSSENHFIILFAILYFIGGSYLILTGIFTLTKKNMRIPGFYKLGRFISSLLFGSAKTAAFEEEIMDPKKVVRYSLLWILIGLVSLAGGIFLLIVE